MPSGVLKAIGRMNNVKKISFLIGLLVITASWSLAQSDSCVARLQGRILGQDTKQPLIGVTVYVRELKTGAVADSVGNFQLSRLCAGSYTLDVQFVGYKTSTVSVRVGNEGVVTVDPVQLAPDNQTLQEVIVTEHRSEAQQLLQTQVSLSGAALDQTRGQSLGESLKALAGLYSIQTGPSISKPVIHGLYSNRIIILNNGIRQEDQQWGTEHAPQVDQFLASRLTVIKGAAASGMVPMRLGALFWWNRKRCRPNPVSVVN